MYLIEAVELVVDYLHLMKIVFKKTIFLLPKLAHFLKKDVSLRAFSMKSI
jgi:hypothetical protein